MSTSKMSIFFAIIEQAKKLGSYSVANQAFACLVDLALDFEKELHFIWQHSPGNDDEDSYYDLLVISDGIRSACISAPLLRKPSVFRSLCRKEEDREEHDRVFSYLISLKEKEIKKELKKIRRKLAGTAPNAGELYRKYLVDTSSDDEINSLGLNQALDRRRAEKEREREKEAAILATIEYERRKREEGVNNSCWSLDQSLKVNFSILKEDCSLFIAGIPVKCREAWTNNVSSNKEEIKNWKGSLWYQPLIEIEGYLVAFESAWCSVRFEGTTSYGSEGVCSFSDSRIVGRFRELRDLQEVYYQKASRRFNPKSGYWMEIEDYQARVNRKLYQLESIT
jgi:hypothetical protein